MMLGGGHKNIVYGTPWNGKSPRRWQKKALPIALREIQRGGSPLIRAATGSGKSLLQGEVIADLIKDIPIESNKRILLTVPTQRLVRQMYQDLHPRLNGRVNQYYQHSTRTDQTVIICCHASLEKLIERMMKYNLEIDCWMADECHKTNGDSFDFMMSRWAPKRLCVTLHRRR